MQGFMIMLLLCSITMSALALLCMAVTPLLAKRYCVMGRYYAWLVFVIGLIIPFRSQLSNPIVKVEISGDTIVPTAHVGYGMSLTTRVSAVIPTDVPHITGWQMAAAIWLSGMILFLAYHIIRHQRFLKLTARWSETVTDGRALALLQDLKTQMGISPNIRLQVCDSIGSPMLVGFVTPCILLPKAGFAKDELCFILKHELVHYKRKDLWYQGLVLLATAIHWFNPIVHLMAKEISILCELSCDAEVVRSTGADTRLSYSETIIDVARYKSKRMTVLSTHFYGGKKGMKSRIFSIMDMSKKKAGAAVLCGALLLTLGTGAAFAVSAETKKPPVDTKELTTLTPQIPIAMMPDPDIYTPYAVAGIAVSEDGTKLLYQGEPVRLFVDDKSNTEVFYWDGAGDLNLSAVRNSAGEITGIESISQQQAQKYYEDFFSEELDPGFFDKVHQESLQDLSQDKVMVNETVQVGGNKYEKYQPFGVIYSTADEALYFHGQRVGFFIDQPANGNADVLWEDDAGAVNVRATRDASGQITGVESISDEKAQEYQSAADEYAQYLSDGLEERIGARMKALDPDN